MFYYNDGTIIAMHYHEIEDVEFDTCLIKSKEFAYNETIGKKFYSTNRRAVNPNGNIILGKMGEFFVADFMNKVLKFPKVSPNLDILTSHNKDWTCDLRYKEHGLDDLHVKACDNNTVRFTGGASWTYQKSNINNNYGEDKLFKDTDYNALTAFVYLENAEINHALIFSIMPWGNVRTILRDPIKKSLIGLKKCVYANDIINKYKIIKEIEGGSINEKLY